MTFNPPNGFLKRRLISPLLSSSFNPRKCSTAYLKDGYTEYSPCGFPMPATLYLFRIFFRTFIASAHTPVAHLYCSSNLFPPLQCNIVLDIIINISSERTRIYPFSYKCEEWLDLEKSLVFDVRCRFKGSATK